MATQGEKRAHPDSQDVLEGIKAILLDIEGTTTPLSFVKDTLFGYVKDNLKTYLESHFDGEECQADVEALRQQAAADKEVEGCVGIASAEDGKEKVIDSIVDNVTWQMGKEAKNTALKQLQGHAYREAYKTGKLFGKVYDDAVDAIKCWTASGKQVYIFSSGSVEAQKLLFGYTEKGDLSAFISGYFDTTTGSKTDKESYTKIAGEMKVDANQVAYFTDLRAEADSAAAAGFSATLVEREGNAPLTDEDKAAYNTIKSFAEITQSDNSEAKRQEVEGQQDESNGAADAEGEVDGDDGDDDVPDEDDDDVDGEVDEEDEAGEGGEADN